MTQSSSTDIALQRAMSLTANGQIDEAAAVLSAALQLDDRQYPISFQLALIEAQRGRWADAERLARSAMMSGDERYACALGHILTKLGKRAEAQAFLHRALAHDPNDAWAHAGLASLYQDQRDLDSALASFDRALTIQPDLPGARQDREKLVSEMTFLGAAARALAEFGRNSGIAEINASTLIEFPSSVVDADGKPRFTMDLPATEIAHDLGAAQIFCHEIAGEGYEVALRRFLDLHLKSDDVFVDVGAHWGIHSLTAATRWPGQIDVIAIEAHPDNGARLLKWTERNQLGAAVEVIQKAIGDHQGKTRLWVNGSSMGHSFRNEGAGVGLTAIDVPLTTLDELLAERPHLRWRRFILKIDVEGCERDVLAGARQLLRTENVVAVIWEKRAFHEAEIQHRLDAQIFDILGSHGFEHFRMEHDPGVGVHLVPLEGNELICDVYSLAGDFPRMSRYG